MPTKPYSKSLALGVLCGLAQTIGIPAQGQPQVVVKLATSAAETSPEAAQLARLSEFLEAKSEGQLRTKVFPGGRLGTGQALVDRVRSGEVQIAAIPFETLAATVPATTVLSAPYVFNNEAHADRALDGAAKRVLDDLLRPEDLRLLGPGPSLFRHWFVGGGAPHNPAELSRYNVIARATPGEQDAWAVLGVPLRPKGSGAAPSAAETGNGPAASAPMFVQATAIEARLAGWDRTATHVVRAQEVLTGSQIVMSERWFAGLPELLIATLGEVEAAGVSEARVALRKADEDLLARMQSRGLAVEPLERSTRRAFRAKAAGIHKAVVNRVGTHGTRLLEAIRGR